MRAESQSRAAKRRAARAAEGRKSKFLKNALRFVGRDIPVFPIAQDAKTPLTKHGFKDAVTDRRQINEWAREFPKANIGIPTGQASGIVVVDLDRKHTVDGVKGFESLCRRLDVEIPDTYKIKTPSGGEHIYFCTKYAAEIRNSAGVLGPGIDVRGEGGYVVAEGSSIDGTRYTCIGGNVDDIKTIPKKLRDAIKNAKKRRRGNGAGTYTEGQRNNALYEEAYRLHATGRSYDSTLNLIHRLNESSCQPPLDGREVEGIVESATSYEITPRPNDSPERALTDMGNSRRFAIANDGKVKFVHELGKNGKYLFREEGQHWRRGAGREYVLAKKSARDLLKEVSQIDDLKTQELVSKFAIRSQSKPMIEYCIKLAQTEPEILASINEFDNKPWEFPVANGVVDLKTGRFRDAGAADNFLNVSPVIYDARAKCPVWRASLRRWQPDPGVRRFLQKVTGLSLIGAVIEELLLFFYGPGGSGKTTYINTVMAMFGPTLGVKLPTSALLTGVRGGNTESSAIAKLRAARFACCSELPQKRSFNESAVKDLSSRDVIFAKALYSNPIQFLPSHTLILYGNQKPSVSASDSGFWRRMREVPFDEVIPKSEMDVNLEQTLLSELPGILNWGIRGGLLYQKDGLSSPKAIQTATKHYQSEVDVIGRFIEECTKRDKKEFVGATALFKALQKYAAASNEFIGDITQTKFGNTVSNPPYSFEKDRRKVGSKKAKIYIGLKMKKRYR